MNCLIERPILEVVGNFTIILDETWHMLRDLEIKVFLEDELLLSGVKLDIEMMIPSLKSNGKSATILVNDIEIETALFVRSKNVFDLPVTQLKVRGALVF